MSSNLVNILGVMAPLNAHSSVSGAQGRGLRALHTLDALIGNLVLKFFSRVYLRTSAQSSQSFLIYF